MQVAGASVRKEVRSGWRHIIGRGQEGKGMEGGDGREEWASGGRKGGDVRFFTEPTCQP